MGEFVISKRPGDELAAIGLGSCIGLAIADAGSGVAALAHVVLPESLGKDGPPAKFADLAVPRMLSELLRAGAARRRLGAVLIGGASMFNVSTSVLDIGARNAEAVREALAKAGIAVVGADTGGSRGRTAMVVIGEQISSRVAGGEARTLMSFAGARAAGALAGRAELPTTSAPTGASR